MEPTDYNLAKKVAALARLISLQGFLCRDDTSRTPGYSLVEFDN
jgi:hypothetical protein